MVWRRWRPLVSDATRGLKEPRAYPADPSGQISPVKELKPSSLVSKLLFAAGAALMMLKTLVAYS